jgi:polyisoprenoid-binding protein YceI
VSFYCAAAAWEASNRARLPTVRKEGEVLARAVFVGCVVLAAGAAARAADVYEVDPAASTMTIHVGKAGLFKFAGHAHEVTAPVFSGRIEADAADLVRSSVTLTFRAADLRVSGEDEPPADLPKVQEAMAGPKVLDAARFDTIRFTSRTVSGRALPDGVFDLRLEGDLELHGVKRPITVPVRVRRGADGTLTAEGTAVVRQTDFGIQPISVAGVVNVKNELGLTFRILARPAAR